MIKNRICRKKIEKEIAERPFGSGIFYTDRNFLQGQVSMPARFLKGIHNGSSVKSSTVCLGFVKK